MTSSEAVTGNNLENSQSKEKNIILGCSRSRIPIHRDSLGLTWSRIKGISRRSDGAPISAWGTVDMVSLWHHVHSILPWRNGSSKRRWECKIGWEGVLRVGKGVIPISLSNFRAELDICFTHQASEQDSVWKSLVVSLLSHVWLFCSPMDCIPPGSSVHGISQANILEWVTIIFSRKSSPGIKPSSPALQAGSLPLSHQGRLLLTNRKVFNWCYRKS